MKEKLRDFLLASKTYFKQYINGAKGAVSLFLVLTFAPLLSIALLMVESARYQGTYSLVQELIDGAAFSTLGNFDDYLDERFNLHAIHQESPVNEAFNGHLDKNKTMLGSSADISGISAAGEFSLLEEEVLKEQIFEASEYTVPAQILGKGLKLDKLFEATSGNNYDKINDFKDAASSTIDAVEKVTTIIEAIKDLIPAALNHHNTRNTYDTAYTAYTESVKDVIDAIDDSSEDDPIKDDADVRMKLRTSQTKANDYAEAAINLGTEKETLVNSINTFFSKINDLPSDYDKIKDKFKKLKEGNKDDSTVEKKTEEGKESEGDDGTTGKTEKDQTDDFLLDVLLKIYEVFDQNIAENYSVKVGTDKYNLERQSNKLGKYEKGVDYNLSEEQTGEDALAVAEMVDDTWTYDTVENRYKKVDLTTFDMEFYGAIVGLQAQLDSMATVDSETTEFIGAMGEFIKDLMNLSVLFDQSINAAVSQSVVISDTSAQISAFIGIHAINNLVNGSNEFVEGLVSGNIIKVLISIGKVLLGIVEFIGGIIAWAGEVLVSLVTKSAQIISGFTGDGIGDAALETILLAGYSVYNMPNRTTVRDNKTLAGYSFMDIPALAGVSLAGPRLGGLFGEDIDTGYGGDKMFTGAISEYILTGVPNEKGAQAATFMDMLYFRMVMNVIPVFQNPAMKALSAAGIAGWVIKTLVLVIESYLDTILLVNGGSTIFYKNKHIWLSAQGIKDYVKELKKLDVYESMTELQKVASGAEKAEKKMPKKDPEPVNYLEEINKTDYTDNMLILMLGSVQDGDMLKRIQNVVNMEAKVYHEANAAFSLDKAYTHVKSTVDYELKTFFNLEGLSAGYQKKTVSYSGY